MRNFLIGLFMVVIIILFGVSMSTAEGRTLRQNELDNNLGKAIEQTLENAIVTKKYKINNNQELIADAIQNILMEMDSQSEYTVTIYGADFEKGILDVGVTQKYKQLYGDGKVSARKTVIADIFSNVNKEYVDVTFYEAEDIIKRIHIYKGDKIPASVIPAKPGYGDWTSNNGSILTPDEVADMKIMENSTFRVWDSTADYCAVTFHAADGTIIKQVAVDKGNKVPYESIPTMEDGTEYTWSSYPSYDVAYTASEVAELTINDYIEFVIN